MSAPAGASPSARRFSAAGWALLALAAVTAIVLVANVIAGRVGARFDVTATGEHELSPRTLAVLSGLDGPYRVVVAGDLRGADPRARERVFDVLDQFRRASARVSVSTIDAGSAEGQGEFDALVADLAERDRAMIESQVKIIGAARAGAEALAVFLEGTLSPSLDGVREAVTPDTPSYERTVAGLRDLAAGARVAAQDLRAAGAATEEPLRAAVRGVPAPATDRAAAVLRDSMSPVIDQLSSLVKQIESLAGTLSPGARDRAAPLPGAIGAARDGAALALEPALRMARPDLRRVADAVSKGAAVLVIGPPGKGMTAVEFTSLFPPAAWLEATGVARADLGRRAEELLGSAVSSLGTPVKPIVVLLHAEPRAFFELAHRFNRVFERLSMRSIDVVEWACAVESEARGLARLNPDGSRPVVYVTLAPNTAAGSGPGGEATGVERAKRLGETVTRLIERDASLLVSLNPSVLAGYGQADPVAAPLEALGIKADTARPIFRERIGPAGRFAVPEGAARAVESGHAIARAVKGQTLYAEWPVALSLSPVGGAEPAALFTIPGSPETWAESQWSNLWVQRSRPELAPEQPSFDAARDQQRDEYIVAAAVERRGAGGAGLRCVVVGANTWFVDDRAEAIRVDGRIVDATPGNLELLEASVYWLARRDELIAASPGALAVPLVAEISGSQLRLVRLLVILGIPALVLLLGALYRWARG